MNLQWEALEEGDGDWWRRAAQQVRQPAAVVGIRAERWATFLGAMQAPQHSAASDRGVVYLLKVRSVHKHRVTKLLVLKINGHWEGSCDGEEADITGMRWDRFHYEHMTSPGSDSDDYLSSADPSPSSSSSYSDTESSNDEPPPRRSARPRRGRPNRGGVRRSSRPNVTQAARRACSSTPSRADGGRSHAAARAAPS
jgi:hypothetical protein